MPSHLISLSPCYPHEYDSFPSSLNVVVVVSSGAVTKPFSPVYLFLNLFGGIMKAKVEGEQQVARLVNNSTSHHIPFIPKTLDSITTAYFYSH